MKTTIEIADALLDAARATADRERTTIRALVEEGLREVLDKRAARHEPFELRDASFRGEGVQPGVDLSNWDQMLALIYEGRGG